MRLFSLAICMAAFLVVGCSSVSTKSQAALTNQDKGYTLSIAGVLVEDGRAVVDGKIRRKPGAEASPSAVQVDMVAEDGSIIATRTVQYFPRILSQRNRRKEGRFTAHFEVVPNDVTFIARTIR